jgi:drug/metabolite transporter (DMT)-like permease
MKKNLTLAWLLLALLACIWGSSFILMKKSLEVFTVNQVASMRLFSAFLFFIPVLITRWQDIPRGRVLWHCFVSGLLGNLLPAFLYAAAGAQIASSLSGLLNSMTPIFTLIVGLAFYQQRIHNRQVLGMGVAFGGSLLLIFGSGKGGDFSVNPYALLVVLATVMYGINLNYVKKHLNNLPSILLTTAVLGTLGPFAGIILFGGDFVERAMRPEATLPLLYTIVLGALGSGLATVLFYRILQITTPVFGSSVTYLIPIVAVMWGVADGERLTLQHYLGMLGILAGVYLVNSLSASRS